MLVLGMHFKQNTDIVDKKFLLFTKSILSLYVLHLIGRSHPQTFENQVPGLQIASNSTSTIPGQVEFEE